MPALEGYFVFPTGASSFPGAFTFRLVSGEKCIVVLIKAATPKPLMGILTKISGDYVASTLRGHKVFEAACIDIIEHSSKVANEKQSFRLCGIISMISQCFKLKHGPTVFLTLSDVHDNRDPNVINSTCSNVSNNANDPHNFGFFVVLCSGEALSLVPYMILGDFVQFSCKVGKFRWSRSLAGGPLEDSSCVGGAASGVTCYCTNRVDTMHITKCDFHHLPSHQGEVEEDNVEKASTVQSVSSSIYQNRQPLQLPPPAEHQQQQQQQSSRTLPAAMFVAPHTMLEKDILAGMECSLTGRVCSIHTHGWMEMKELVVTLTFPSPAVESLLYTSSLFAKATANNNNHSHHTSSATCKDININNNNATGMVSVVVNLASSVVFLYPCVQHLRLTALGVGLRVGARVSLLRVLPLYLWGRLKGFATTTRSLIEVAEFAIDKQLYMNEYASPHTSTNSRPNTTSGMQGEWSRKPMQVVGKSSLIVQTSGHNIDRRRYHSHSAVSLAPPVDIKRSCVLYSAWRAELDRLIMDALPFLAKRKNVSNTAATNDTSRNVMTKDDMVIDRMYNEVVETVESHTTFSPQVRVADPLNHVTASAPASVAILPVLTHECGASSKSQIPQRQQPQTSSSLQLQAASSRSSLLRSQRQRLLEIMRPKPLVVQESLLSVNCAQMMVRNGQDVDYICNHLPMVWSVDKFIHKAKEFISNVVNVPQSTNFSAYLYDICNGSSTAVTSKALEPEDEDEFDSESAEAAVNNIKPTTASTTTTERRRRKNVIVLGEVVFMRLTVHLTHADASSSLPGDFSSSSRRHTNDEVHSIEMHIVSNGYHNSNDNNNDDDRRSTSFNTSSSGRDTSENSPVPSALRVMLHQVDAQSWLEYRNICIQNMHPLVTSVHAADNNNNHICPDSCDVTLSTYCYTSSSIAQKVIVAVHQPYCLVESKPEACILQQQQPSPPPPPSVQNPFNYYYPEIFALAPVSKVFVIPTFPVENSPRSSNSCCGSGSSRDDAPCQANCTTGTTRATDVTTATEAYGEMPRASEKTITKVSSIATTLISSRNTVTAPATPPFPRNMSIRSLQMLPIGSKDTCPAPSTSLVSSASSGGGNSTNTVRIASCCGVLLRKDLLRDNFLRDSRDDGGDRTEGQEVGDGGCFENSSYLNGMGSGSSAQGSSGGTMSHLHADGCAGTAYNGKKRKYVNGLENSKQLTTRPYRKNSTLMCSLTIRDLHYPDEITLYVPYHLIAPSSSSFPPPADSCVPPAAAGLMVGMRVCLRNVLLCLPESRKKLYLKVGPDPAAFRIGCIGLTTSMRSLHRLCVLSQPVGATASSCSSTSSSSSSSSSSSTSMGGPRYLDPYLLSRGLMRMPPYITLRQLTTNTTTTAAAATTTTATTTTTAAAVSSTRLAADISEKKKNDNATTDKDSKLNSNNHHPPPREHPHQYRNGHQNKHQVESHRRNRALWRLVGHVVFVKKVVVTLQCSKCRVRARQNSAGRLKVFHPPTTAAATGGAGGGTCNSSNAVVGNLRPSDSSYPLQQAPPQGSLLGVEFQCPKCASSYTLQPYWEATLAFDDGTAECNLHVEGVEHVLPLLRARFDDNGAVIEDIRSLVEHYVARCGILVYDKFQRALSVFKPYGLVVAENQLKMEQLKQQQFAVHENNNDHHHKDSSGTLDDAFIQRGDIFDWRLSELNKKLISRVDLKSNPTNVRPLQILKSYLELGDYSRLYDIVGRIDFSAAAFNNIAGSSSNNSSSSSNARSGDSTVTKEIKLQSCNDEKPYLAYFCSRPSQTRMKTTMQVYRVQELHGERLRHNAWDLLEQVQQQQQQQQQQQRKHEHQLK